MCAMNNPPFNGVKNIPDYSEMQLAYSNMPPFTEQNLSGSPDDGRFPKVFKEILKAIKAEAEATDFYQRLSRFAPNQKHRDDIMHALEDERIHLRQFTNLYVRLTGCQPVYKPERKMFQTYIEGLKMAYRDELEAYEHYRNIYLLTRNPMIRDVFFRGFTDEIEHAVRFGFLISGYKK